MAIHTYQCAGYFTKGHEIIPDNRHIKTIHKLGIQGREGALINLNHMRFEIGKAGVLFYEDAEIEKVQISNDNSYKEEFLIIDFTYSDYED